MKKTRKITHISRLKVPRVSDVNLSRFDRYRSSLDFSNPKKVRKLLLEHFAEGDHETFFDILVLYLDHVGKSTVSRKTKIPERTLYNFITKEHKTSSENIFKMMKFLADEEKKAA